VAARVSSPSFVGRGPELAALDSALARAAAGRSTAVLLGGDAGMGKSRLVAEFEQRADHAGAEVLVGECVELSQGELPYGPIVVALRPLLARAADGPAQTLHPGARAALARLWTDLEVPDVAAGVEFAQGQLFEAVHRLIAAQAAVRPVALVVEDLHWADHSTRDLLTFLIRNSRRERVLFLCTFRTDEVHRRHPLHPLISELERSGRAERLTLEPFGEEELREQLGGILGERPGPQLVNRLLVRSEGNPFFAEELLAAADQGVMPDSLREALLVRVQRLSDPARGTLALAAAVGRPAEHQLLATASELESLALGEALREAVEQRFLVTTEDGTGYAFRHALLREAVYTDLLPGERTALHARLGDALSSDQPLLDSGRAAAELAHHWQIAGRPGHALSASLQAGEQAESVHAYTEAGRHLERALELWERVPEDDIPPGARRTEIAWRAADAAAFSGAYRRAIALARQLVTSTAEHPNPTAAGLSRARLARYHWLDGNSDAALDDYATALELVAPEPSIERAEVLAANAHVLLLMGRLREARERAEEALRIARAVGARRVEASALNTLGPTREADGERALIDLHDARAIAEELGAVEEIGRSYVNECHVLETLDRLPQAVAVGVDGIARARDLGAERNWGDYLAAEVADRLWTLGDWDQAARRAGDVLDFGPLGLSAASAHTSLGRIAAERGEFEQAREHVARSEEISARAGVMWVAPNKAILAACAVWSGDPDEAHSIVAAGAEQIGDTEMVLFAAPLFAIGIRAEAERAERARALGHQPQIEEATEVARSLLARLQTGDANGGAERLACDLAMATAELSRLLGNNDPKPWLAAAEMLLDAGRPYQAAYSQWRAAAAMAHAGDSSGAVRQLLRDAAETAHHLGARPLLDEVASLARRARVELGRAGADSSSPASTDDLGLTVREREVLLLVAAGRTNRQIGEELFMSEKTASVHVSRIVSKLRVANRAEAAGVAHTLRLGPPVTEG
jgi:DNA-binding CsgD family transcriptional regulator/tetratricopeptide (TPR) repeat protein